MTETQPTEIIANQLGPNDQIILGKGSTRRTVTVVDATPAETRHHVIVRYTRHPEMVDAGWPNFTHTMRVWAEQAFESVA